MPFPVDEEKPGIYPGRFQIPKSEDGSPQLLVIGNSIHHVQIEGGSGSVTIPTDAITMAKSIVNDYCDGMLGYSEPKKCVPGFFYLEGEVSVKDLESKHATVLNDAKAKQKNWFIALIKLADDEWEKTRQHKFISDVQRFAATSLGFDRPWIVKDEQEVVSKDCIACKSKINPEAIVCPICKTIVDAKKYKELQLAGV